MKPVRVGFVLEYSLGHATHARNLKAVLGSDGSRAVEPVYVDVPFDATPVGAWGRLPPVRSNWSIRASLAAYRALKPLAGVLDAALFHTQVTALFSAGLMRRVRSVVSLDATPIQIDGLGAAYGHAAARGGPIEALKKRLNSRAFAAARHLVTWSEWAKGSLVADYGVPAAKVTVIPPGIDTDLWSFAPRERATGDPVNLLFVGGDFARKGGDTLLAAYDALPAGVRARTQLHLVTRTAPLGTASARAGVTVYSDLTANSDALRRLYSTADLFVFPTRGDCLPLAVLEALSSGLPVVTTPVGALPEAVTDGETGRIVTVDDVQGLGAVLESLIGDGDERSRMGRNARAVARARFDAAWNYARLIETVKNQGAAR